MTFRARVVEPPEPIVTFEEAQRRLRDIPADEQADVEAMIAAATGHIDGPQGWLGRAIGRQTLEVDFYGFDEIARDLPYPEIASVAAVSYLDAAGARIALPTSDFELLGNRLVPVIGTSWPAAVYAGDRAAVRVRYVAGYEVVPAAIKAAVLVMTVHAYMHRDDPVAVIAASSQLLEPFRIYR